MHRSFGPDLVALAEEPGARDDEDVGVAPDVGRESGEGRRHAHDLERGVIEQLQARGALQLDLLDRTVGKDVHRQSQVAIELTARPGGKIEGADSLDLVAPVFLVLREAILHGVCAHGRYRHDRGLPGREARRAWGALASSRSPARLRAAASMTSSSARPDCGSAPRAATRERRSRYRARPRAAGRRRADTFSGAFLAQYHKPFIF